MILYNIMLLIKNKLLQNILFTFSGNIWESGMSPTLLHLLKTNLEDKFGKNELQNNYNKFYLGQGETIQTTHLW